MPNNEWIYLGDSVYGLYDGYQIRLITGTPDNIENEIDLIDVVFDEFLFWVNNFWPIWKKR
jgi:hypothetical protein